MDIAGGIQKKVVREEDTVLMNHKPVKHKEESKDSSKKPSISSTVYEADKVIGNGSFGVVYLAHAVNTGELVAIKKVFQDKRYKNRELQIMRELNHPNTVILKQAFFSTGENIDEIYLNIVMDYVPENVHKVLKDYIRQKRSMPILSVKLYAYQLFRAIAYIHALGICHRDIKPQNLLVDISTHTVKLCDFGSAKKLSRTEPNVAYICSRYYRAPELIFGATDYTNAIDVWSSGCVVAELLLGEPLFPGENSTDQLVEIIKVLGTPTRQQIRAMNYCYSTYKFPQIKAHPWHTIFPEHVPKLAVEFIKSVLIYDPTKRPTPIKALLHPFFDELREEGTKLLDGSNLPDLFDFTNEELSQATPEEMEVLVPKWWREKK